LAYRHRSTRDQLVQHGISPGLLIDCCANQNTSSGELIMALTLRTDQLNDYIGKEVGVSEWMLVDQERINQFAEATGDHQYIHVDPERAAKTPFGTTIAHGFLTMTFFQHFLSNGRRENSSSGVVATKAFGIQQY